MQAKSKRGDKQREKVNLMWRWCGKHMARLRKRRVKQGGEVHGRTKEKAKWGSNIKR